MQTPELFTLLPEEYVATPDGMSIDREGNLILSCPNFANMDLPSCVLKIDKDRNIRKWFDVPVNPETGEARSMGIHTDRLRAVVILCATLVTSASVAVSGMIGWVGLVIPHFSRLLFGYDYRRLIPASILMGGTFLLIVDDIARVAATAELPLGILTSFVGAPVFIWMILSGGGRRAR